MNTFVLDLYVILEALFYVFVITAIAYVVGFLVAKVIARWQLDSARAHHSEVNRNLALFVKRFIVCTGFLFALAFVYQKNGGDVSALIIGLGLGTVALTVLIQKPILNVITGLLILWDGHLSVGDRVEKGGRDYVVKKLDLRFVVLEDNSASGKEFYPNAEFYNTKFKIKSGSGLSRRYPTKPIQDV